MKNLTIPLSFALVLSALPAESASAAAANNPPASPQQAALTPEAALAAQVAEIAATTTLTREVQESLISSAVRLAISTAIEGVGDPAQVLRLALQLTTAAAKAAPRFSDAILKTAAALPSLAGIPGGATQIQAAVLDAVMAAGSADVPSGLAPAGGAPAGAPSTPTPSFSGNANDIRVSPSH